MNRRQRAIACAVGIIPVTICNFTILLLDRPALAWLLELSVGAAYFLWIIRRHE
jgi:hypothetical protein